MLKVSENQQVEMRVGEWVTIPFKIGDKAYSEAIIWVIAFRATTQTRSTSNLHNQHVFSGFHKDEQRLMSKKIKELFKTVFFLQKTAIINTINIAMSSISYINRLLKSKWLVKQISSFFHCLS
jgi:hypothetical protein